MPRPERRMGTRQMFSGVIWVVVYSKPIDVTSLGPGAVVKVAARASLATRREISWTRDLTSFAAVDFERSLLSLASRHGCAETWTLEGTEAIVMVMAAAVRVQLKYV